MSLPAAQQPDMADHLVNYLNGGQSGAWTSFVQPIDQYGGGQWEGMAMISTLPITQTGWFTMPAGSDGNRRRKQYATQPRAAGRRGNVQLQKVVVVDQIPSS